jgi:hypothetical protein
LEPRYHPRIVKEQPVISDYAGPFVRSGLFLARFLIRSRAMLNRLLAALMVLAFPALAAEKKFDFSDLSEGAVPPGFRSTITGEGKPGKWTIVLDDVPSPMQILSAQGKSLSKRPVLAQLAQDPADEHFPMLIFDQESFGDFTLTTRFKTVRGSVEQMAGIAFRIRNETNFYVLRASSLGNTFRFYRVVDGQRGAVVGPEVSIPSGVWHELGVECKGNQIRGLLDGKELINVTDKASPLTDGKFAFWTKSDSVSYFADTKIHYTPKEMPAQVIVRDVLKRYPRLLDLKIYVAGANSQAPRLIGTKSEYDPQRLGGDPEKEVISQGRIYYGKDNGYVSVTMPLRDRNGESIAAARIVMKTFAGQTEQNALARAMPIVKEMQVRIQSLQDLVD